jgi:Spy/CpxP family protein refolding chaperone
MKACLPLLAAAFFFAAPAAHAQPPAGGAPDGKGPQRSERMHDCAKAADPKACEERREKMRAAVKSAREACEGKQGDARRECMIEQGCARSKDPAQCLARAKERAERHKARAAEREKMREACKDKKGDEMRNCLREQRGKSSPRKPEAKS